MNTIYCLDTYAYDYYFFKEQENKHKIQKSDWVVRMWVFLAL